MPYDLVNIRLEGMDDIAAALQELPLRIQTNVIRGACRAAAVVLKDEAVNQAPEWSVERDGHLPHGHPPPGTLKRSLYVTYDKRRSTKSLIRYWVKCRSGSNGKGGGDAKANSNKDAYYWKWIEFGHMYVPPGHAGFTKKAKARGFSDLSVGAKWVPANPFMRRAFEAKKGQAVAAARDYMLQRIPLEVLVLGAKYRLKT